MKMRLFLLFLISTGLIYCQSSTQLKNGFKKADSIASQFPESSIQNLPFLVYGLTHSLKDDYQKFRAIFVWVSTHIANDYHAYERTAAKQKRFVERREKYLEWNNSYLPKVYKRLTKHYRTTCTGYAYLIEQMALLAGLECKVIDGYGKTAATQLNAHSAPNHSWNAVKLNGNWALCDATWSAGTVALNQNAPSFTFDFSEAYFLPPAELFALNHYPLDPKWLLLDTSFGFEEFLEAPLIYRAAFELGVLPKLPGQMVVTIAQNQSLVLQMKTHTALKTDHIELFIVNGNEAERHTPKVTTFNNGEATLEHLFYKKGTYDVHVMVNEKAIATYVVTVLKNSTYP